VFKGGGSPHGVYDYLQAQGPSGDDKLEAKDRGGGGTFKLKDLRR